MVLFSGDGDFRSLVESIQRKGVRVSVVSTISTQPPMVADELRRQADEFIDLTHLIQRIGRDPSERPPRTADHRRSQFATAPAAGRRTARVSVDRAGPMAFDVGPPRDCPLARGWLLSAPRTRRRYPDWSNAPVASFGEADARLLIVGLAPGLRGANRTGRPFTGDYAGDLLYARCSNSASRRGAYDRRPDDGLELVDCAIVNAVRCVPPQNKPTPQEIATCRPYLRQAIAALPKLRVVLALGRIAHESALRALGLQAGAFRFRPWRAA